MPKLRPAPFASACLSAALLLGLAGAAHAADFKVVVNDANPVDGLDEDELSRIFLKKTTRWPNGSAVLPVDGSPDSAVRESFSRAVHDKEVPWIKSYWQRQIFSGRETPPPELASARDVLDYVSRTPGAIGYVDTGAPLGNGVKQLRITR